MNVTTLPRTDIRMLEDPREIRKVIRAGAHTERTYRLAMDRVQANLAIVPADFADELLRFCLRNPRPCPVLAVSEVGSPKFPTLGEDLDVRTDLPKYRIWREGGLEKEITDIREYWREDFVAFALGCSLSFEQAIDQDGIAFRVLDDKTGRRSCYYDTNVDCVPAGRFRGKLVVSMRLFKPADAIRVVQITSRFPAVHGAPVHIGKPHLIGIDDLVAEDGHGGGWEEPHDDEIPVFWGCGVTPQRAIVNARPPISITHAPSHMLVTDVLNSKYSVL